MAQLRRVYPDPAELEQDAFLDELELTRSGAGDRPHLALNMVMSVDGRAAIDGGSASLTGPVDRKLFHALRGSADAVLVGPRTLSAERYGPLVRGADRRRARVDRGLTPVPLACVIARSGQVDFSVALFDDPEQRVIVFTAGAPPAVDCAADLTVLRLSEAELEPRAVLQRLAVEHGVRSVLCEGGPTLNAGLLRAGVVDELFVSVSPQLAGGADPLPIVAGDTGAPVRLALAWLLEAEAMLFLRYGVIRGE